MAEKGPQSGSDRPTYRWGCVKLEGKLRGDPNATCEGCPVLELGSDRSPDVIVEGSARDLKAQTEP